MFRLSNTKREDITLIGFQVWVLGMSIVALLNESIPHISAALFTQLLVTIWSLFQVSETEHFRQNFARIITNNACHGQILLGTYWQDRKIAEILSAILNGVGFLVTAVLTYKLMKVRLVKFTCKRDSHSYYPRLFRSTDGKLSSVLALLSLSIESINWYCCSRLLYS